MIHFFGNQSNTVFAVQVSNPETSGEISSEDINKLNWLFGNAHKIEKSVLSDFFVGPRGAIITPWRTNAVEITQNMGISGIIRIEEFEKVAADFSNQFINNELYDFSNINLFDTCLIARSSTNNNPDFKDARNNKLIIGENSAAKGTADNTYFTFNDILNNQRNGATDMGAYNWTTFD